MGGLITAVGFAAGIITAISLRTFFNIFISESLISVLAALPLMALKEGYSFINIPFIGLINCGICYSLVLVPLGITGAANAANMLAGFNGLEAGMGIVIVVSLSIIAYLIGEMTALIILLAALGALLATIYYNWYPAKIFIGDIGTLSIGAIIATAIIEGGFESAGVIIVIPYAVDFLIKAKNKFPARNWWGTYKDGKLYCPDNGPVGLCQLIMKVCGGISERNLVLVLMSIEAIFGVAVILLYI